MEKIDPNAQEFKDQVVAINRVTKVVKGGKNLSFSALVVVGDQNGMVGYGMGKAKEVPQAIRKGVEQARKNMIRIPLQGRTIPHVILGRYGAGRVILKPASEGTGVIAEVRFAPWFNPPAFPTSSRNHLAAPIRTMW